MAGKKKTSASSGSSSAEIDSITAEINSFIKKNANIDVESLEDRDFIPEFLDTGNFALNWAISGQLKGGGVPKTKCIEFFGDPGCLHEDTEIELFYE